MNEIYAIADIHGQLAHLETALARIEADGGPNAEIVFLGDYIDRGPESKAVIERLIAGREAGRPWTMLRGNHDEYLRLFVKDGNAYGSLSRADLSWFDPILGGTETMESYGVQTKDRDFTEIRRDALAKVPESHLSFLDSLPYYHETEAHIFVHAGIRPGIAMADQDLNDLIWIRAAFHEDTRDHGKLVVHGHTPVQVPKHYGNRVNLDAGAGKGRPIYPAVFRDREAWLLTEAGRVALEPGKTLTLL